jgi:hypothetical protein
MFKHVLIGAGTAMLAAAPGAADSCVPANAGQHVIVIIDMDGATPGCQSNINVPAGTSQVHGASVWIIDPLGSREMYSIGFVGAIDRGIVFGHVPSGGNRGTVSALGGTVGPPVNPGNFNFALNDQMIISSFAGAELSYSEMGARRPSIIPSAPTAPILTIDVSLAGASAGDVFRFYLADAVALQFGAGAFSTKAPINSLDCGGDSVPDGTPSNAGIDADDPLPSPPAAFAVDFIDGPAGMGATITIVPRFGDLNGDGEVGPGDLAQLLASWGQCAGCTADLDHDGAVGPADLAQLLAHWG